MSIKPYFIKTFLISAIVLFFILIDLSHSAENWTNKNLLLGAWEFRQETSKGLVYSIVQFLTDYKYKECGTVFSSSKQVLASYEVCGNYKIENDRMTLTVESSRAEWEAKKGDQYNLEITSLTPNRLSIRYPSGTVSNGNRIRQKN